MNTNEKTNRSLLILAMVIFGTVGIFRRYIPLASSVVALVRGIIGTLFLLGYLKIRGQHIDQVSVRKRFPVLLISGAAIGFNWILLFEAYLYTSVATATLCYYLAPILVILGAAFFLRESLSLKKGICTAAALVGMVFVSGVTESGGVKLSEMKGILFGLGAAVLYASVILMNKKMTDIPALDKTVFQLGFAALALLPYVLITENLGQMQLEPLALILLFVMGIVHTGIAYLLYFGSMGGLKANTIALLSYIDPVLAIILSAVLFREPMTIGSTIGAFLILGAAFISEKS